MNSLFIFVDESGNMDFGPKGTKHFVMSALSMISPLESSKVLQKLKYELLTESNGGAELQNFHATEDLQDVRNRVLNCINELQDISVNWLWIEKQKTPSNYRTRDKFYSLLGGALSKTILRKYRESKFDKIIIIFDRTLNFKEQNEFFGSVKPKLSKIGKPYAIYFHQTLSDFNLQIADYFSWAKYVSLERGEDRPLKAIENISQEEYNIF